MTKTVQLEAQPLTANTKGEVKRLRASGYVPVSVQHKQRETLHLQEEEKPLNDFILLHGSAGVAEMTVGTDHVRRTVVVHDVQRDPISKRLLHVTFQEMEKGDTIKTHVAIVLHGEPQAVRNGEGLLTQALTQLDIRSDMQHLVDHVTIDVSNLELGSSLRVSDLPKADGYEILTPADTLIVAVTAPTAPEPVAETAPEVAEASAEPTE